jgi:hypothetical protein
MSKYPLNENFFKNITTEIQSYLLGFYLGDGCVSYRESRKEYCFKITVSEKDEYILNLYQEHISNRPLYKTQPLDIVQNDKVYKCSPALSFTIYSKTLVEDLVNIGYGYKKTYLTKSLPNLNNDLMKHFIRGYFDADGTCVNNLIKRSDRPIGTRAKSVFRITSYDKNILNELQTYLNNLLQINLKVYNCNTRNVFNLSSSNLKDIHKLYSYFYEDSMFYFKRKKLKFEDTMLTPRELRELKNSELRNA